MIKILLKSLLLICIILSIYFIVNPSACSNLLAGRVVNPDEAEFPYEDNSKPARAMLVPQGDSHEGSEPQKDAKAAGIYDTNTLQQQGEAQVPPQDQASQEDTDYAIANRYIELEREYADQGKDTTSNAKEIAYIVMDDFEMTPKEWDAFLQRATESNLFEKIREENK